MGGVWRATHALEHRAALRCIARVVAPPASYHLARRHSMKLKMKASGENAL